MKENELSQFVKKLILEIGPLFMYSPDKNYESYMSHNPAELINFLKSHIKGQQEEFLDERDCLQNQIDLLKIKNNNLEKTELMLRRKIMSSSHCC